MLVNFFTPVVSSDFLAISYYNIVRKDAVRKYICSSVNFSIQTLLDTITLESIAFKAFQVSTKPLLTSLLYTPPNSSVPWTDNFSTHVLKNKDICGDVIVLHDLNINLSVSNSKPCNSVKQL